MASGNDEMPLASDQQLNVVSDDEEDIELPPNVNAVRGNYPMDVEDEDDIELPPNVNTVRGNYPMDVEDEDDAMSLED
jgi:hypothetical protein